MRQVTALLGTLLKEHPKSDHEEERARERVNIWREGVKG
jgi:hypothetical protein